MAYTAAQATWDLLQIAFWTAVGIGGAAYYWAGQGNEWNGTTALYE